MESEPDVSQTQAQGIVEAKAKAEHQSPAPVSDAGRRGFLHRMVAVLVGGFVMIVPATAGVLTFFSPVRRRRGRPNDDTTGAGAEGKPFIRITSLAAVPDDGKPHRFPVIADRVDAWTIERDVPIGSVYLRRSGDKVFAFNTRCPHLGCAVDARPDGTFACPCHDSSFHVDGSLMRGVSARGLDELEVDPKSIAKGDIKVRYMEFETGRADKVAKACRAYYSR
jgi:Rieske Fe-S protein